MPEEATPEASTPKNGEAKKAKQEGPIKCGLVMPISDIDGYPPGHWQEVRNILTSAIEANTEVTFAASLVSDADDSGVIHKRIIQNLYDCQIVVCDLSAKNANVMFELGMRLAFDKPTVLVKDDRTGFSFDTGVIEHIEYSSDLRFASMNVFMDKLSRKVLATYQRSLKAPAETSFLKSFGKFQVQKLDEEEVTPHDALLAMMAELQRDMRRLSRPATSSGLSEMLPDDLPLTLSDISQLHSVYKNLNPDKTILDVQDFAAFIRDRFVDGLATVSDSKLYTAISVFARKHFISHKSSVAV